MDGQKHVIPGGPVSDNYNSIEWTPFRGSLLADFYNESPIDMQCNQSDGTRFPGAWDHMSVPEFPALEPKLNPNLDPECKLETGSHGVEEREEKLEELLTVARRSSGGGGIFPA